MDKFLSFITAGIYGTIKETFSAQMYHTGYTVAVNSVLIMALFMALAWMYKNKADASNSINIADANAMVMQIKMDAARNSIQSKINNLLDKNDDLRIQRLYVEKPSQRNMIDDLVKNNEARIEQLRHEDNKLAN